MSKKAGKAISNELTVIGDSVPNVLELLSAKLTELKTVTECSYKTGGKLDGFGDIRQQTQVENLIRAFSSVQGKEEAYHKSAKALGKITYPAFSVSGGNTEAWLHDIKLRMAVIEHADTKAALEALTEEGKKFLTEKDQYAIYLQKASAKIAELGLSK